MAALERRQEMLSGPGFVRRVGASAAVADGYLYIDGGVLATMAGGNITTEAPDTLAIPVTNSWTNKTLRGWRTPKRGVPRTRFQSLFTNEDESALYAWAGESVTGNANNTSRQLWRLDPNGFGSGNWVAEEPSNPQVFKDIIRSAMSTTATCRKKAFFLGGWANKFTDPNIDVPGTRRLATSGLVTYDTRSKTWANESAADAGPPGPRFRGNAVCLPEFGQDGVVMFLGGLQGHGPENAVDEDHDLELILMDQVTLYDPATKTWHHQNTTGPYPTPRNRGCVVTAKGPGNSREIFVYGGLNTFINTAYDELYVLSVPGFVWHRADYVPRSPRADHACVVAGNRQMIIVGGENAATSTPEDIYGDRDPWEQGIGVLDLSALQWSSSFDSSAAAYVPPGVVQSWYDNGGLKNVQWANSQVEALFTGPVGSSGPNVGAIAGGVVGGVAALAIIAAIIFFCLRRDRRQRDARNHDSEGLPGSQRGTDGWTGRTSSTIPRHEMATPETHGYTPTPGTGHLKAELSGSEGVESWRNTPSDRGHSAHGMGQQQAAPAELDGTTAGVELEGSMPGRR